MSQTLDQLIADATERTYRQIERDVAKAHLNSQWLGSYHRRSLAQRFRSDRTPKERKQ